MAVIYMAGFFTWISSLQELPRALLIAYAITVKATLVEISWLPSPDDFENGALRYTIDCFRCLSSEDKNCNKLHQVQYSPSKGNISGVEVAIYGLPSASYFLLRVYSVNELNRQEQNRDVWNFAEDFFKTKVVALPLLLFVAKKKGWLPVSFICLPMLRKNGDTESAEGAITQQSHSYNQLL